jgi:acyl-CoA synthetase (AMP-forming)/AMP-acid ligase II
MPATLAELIALRAERQGDDPAFRFFDGRGELAAELTYRALFRKAAGVAAALRERARPGDRALLVYPPGLDFLAAFLGCALARVVPAPLALPRRLAGRDASAEILADCRPALGLTVAERLDLGEKLPIAGPWIATDSLAERDDAFDPPAPNELALLQYTSGSTSAPKGVMVSHANLIANLAMIAEALGNDERSSYASWTPLFHDMGLILNALQALYVGAPCHLMAPGHFVQRPLAWLKLISRYRIEVAGCPNFGYDLCVDRLRPETAEGLDLSSWRVAFNGAEPVRRETLERFAAAFAPYGFRREAFYPCYGMAEATLLISGPRPGEPVSARPPADDPTPFVACGRALAGESLAIVDPETFTRRPAGAVGEIWAQGPHISRGYWSKPEATAAAFQARIAGEAGEWLRTGDLGFVDEDSRLYPVGRIKDLVIIRGANHHPQDIERTVEECHPALSRHNGAAFAVDFGEGEQLVIVQEVERAERGSLDAEEVENAIREAVTEAHEVSPHRIVLLRPGALPKTTSGKIQRSLARRLFLEGRLSLLEGPAF